MCFDWKMWDLADRLYTAGYDASRKGRDYDPRGCKEWAEIVGALTQQPESEPAGELTSKVSQLGNFLARLYPGQEMQKGDKFYTGPQPTPQVPDNWLPTPENINALPDPVRGYIHDLVTNADPAGMVRENITVRDENKMLRALIAEQVPEGCALIPLDARYSNPTPKITNLMKSVCTGEFSFNIEVSEISESGEVTGEVIEQDVEVPWDTVKAIYKMMASVALLAAPSIAEKREVPCYPECQ